MLGWFVGRDGVVMGGLDGLGLGIMPELGRLVGDVNGKELGAAKIEGWLLLLIGSTRKESFDWI